MVANRGASGACDEYLRAAARATRMGIAARFLKFCQQGARKREPKNNGRRQDRGPGNWKLMLGFLVLNKRKGREGWCHYVTTTLSGVLVQIHSNHTHHAQTKRKSVERMLWWWQAELGVLYPLSPLLKAGQAGSRARGRLPFGHPGLIQIEQHGVHRLDGSRLRPC